jgi:two-component system sensor histidine kinase KdpD
LVSIIRRLDVHATRGIACKRLVQADFEAFLRPCGQAYAVTMRTRLLGGMAASTGAVAVVSLAVYALRPAAPVVSLGVLYLFAVLPIAVFFGLRFAVLVSVVSMLAFNWFFLPPRHTFHLAESEDWVALAVYLVTAVSVSVLADRARRRAAEAEEQRREAAYAAEVSALLLGQPSPESQLPAIAVLTADLLGVTHCWIELGPSRSPDPDEQVCVLEAGGHHVGQLFLESAGVPDAGVLDRVMAVLSALLATAIEREQLSRSDATKTAVLRSVSHDLRSPLTAIGTASEMLSDPRERLSASDRDELLASIRDQARRLDRLVANLLDLSRLEAGAASPVPELWAVDELVGRALEAIGADGDRVVVSLSDECPAVLVDAAQLERVLVNLVENALGYSSPSDPVEVEAVVAGDEVVVSVVDHGPGLARDELESIFEPFRRGSGARERGSGLGLAIARGFASLNGGRLWVDSVPGRGATFSLALPAVEVASKVGA